MISVDFTPMIFRFLSSDSDISKESMNCFMSFLTSSGKAHFSSKVPATILTISFLCFFMSLESALPLCFLPYVFLQHFFHGFGNSGIAFFFRREHQSQRKRINRIFFYLRDVISDFMDYAFRQFRLRELFFLHNPAF